MGFEPHSVAGSALKPASRLLLRGPAPSHAPHERGVPLSKSPGVGSIPQRPTYHVRHALRFTFHGLRVKREFHWRRVSGGDYEERLRLKSRRHEQALFGAGDGI